jgi:hypothetical protein
MKSLSVKIVIGVVVAFSVAIAFCFILDWRPGDSNWEVGRSIGTYSSRDGAVSASLKKLSQEIRRHPATENYRVYFDLSARDKHGAGGATFYDRKFKQIGFENDPGSGFVVYWTNVDDTAIHAAAATNGTFLSFGREAWYSEASYAP